MRRPARPRRLAAGLDRLGEAREILERALEIARNVGERPGELRANELLGVILRNQDRPSAVRGEAGAARWLAHELGSPAKEGFAQ